MILALKIDFVIHEFQHWRRVRDTRRGSSGHQLKTFESWNPFLEDLEQFFLWSFWGVRYMQENMVSWTSEIMSWFWVVTKNQKFQNLVVRELGIDPLKVLKCSHDQFDHFCVLPELLKFFCKKNFRTKKRSLWKIVKENSNKNAHKMTWEKSMMKIFLRLKNEWAISMKSSFDPGRLEGGFQNK